MFGKAQYFFLAIITETKDATSTLQFKCNKPPLHTLGCIGIERRRIEPHLQLKELSNRAGEIPKIFEYSPSKPSNG